VLNCIRLVLVRKMLWVLNQSFGKNVMMTTNRIDIYIYNIEYHIFNMYDALVMSIFGNGHERIIKNTNFCVV